MSMVRLMMCAISSGNTGNNRRIGKKVIVAKSYKSIKGNDREM